MIVVAGVDESPVSKTVLDRAIEQARWRGADLHVIHVRYIPVVYSEVPVDMTEFSEAQGRATWEALDPILAENEDVPITKVDLDGYPPDTLVDYTKDQEASLLVVGTRGRGELAALILGSTSHRAIHLSECDVLVVKAGT